MLKYKLKIIPANSQATKHCYKADYKSNYKAYLKINISEKAYYRCTN